jgi:hypothetical protein
MGIRGHLAVGVHEHTYPRHSSWCHLNPRSGTGLGSCLFCNVVRCSLELGCLQCTRIIDSDWYGKEGNITHDRHRRKGKNRRHSRYGHEWDTRTRARAIVGTTGTRGRGNRNEHLRYVHSGLHKHP